MILTKVSKFVLFSLLRFSFITWPDVEKSHSLVNELSGKARMVRANLGWYFKSLEFFQNLKICVP